MKYLPYIVIAVLILFIVFRPARVESVPGEVVRDTIITNRIDTVRDTIPVPVYESVVDSFPFVVPVPVPGDTVRDTVYLRTVSPGTGTGTTNGNESTTPS